MRARNIGMCALLWACGADLEGEAPLESAQHAIYQGEPASDEQYAAVGQLFMREGGTVGSRCSAVLIAPEVVVSARHCVSIVPADLEGLGCTNRGDLIDEHVGLYVGDRALEDLTVRFQNGGNTTRQVRAFAYPPTNGIASACKDDLVLLWLNKPISSVSPLALRFDRRTARDELLELVGYGEGTNAESNRARATAEVSSVGPDSVTTQVDYETPPRTLLFEHGRACKGDSGGPALDRESFAVVGIASHGRAVECGSAKTDNIYTHIPMYRDFIRDTFAAWGLELAAIDLGAPGAACEDGAYCETGLCAGTPKVCAAACGEGDTCPAGFVCEPNERGRACAELPPPEQTSSSSSSGAPSSEPSEPGGDDEPPQLEDTSDGSSICNCDAVGHVTRAPALLFALGALLLRRRTRAHGVRRR